MGERPVQAYPLFNGLARPALVAGVPMYPMGIMLVTVIALTFNFGAPCLVLAPILWGVMAFLTKLDVNYFRILWLAVETKLRNRNKAFWKASTYSIHKPKKR